jgi:hypothetical protein
MVLAQQQLKAATHLSKVKVRLQDFFPPNLAEIITSYCDGGAQPLKLR